MPGRDPTPIIGIDLGTTNSLVAWCPTDAPERGPVVIPGEDGRTLLPSVVRYSAAGSIESVGSEARDRAHEAPGRTIASIKRLMGRSRADSHADLPYLPYEVIEGPNNTARVRLPRPGEADTVVSPPEVSAAILRALRIRAEKAIGRPVEKAVVTVPAYFDDVQRQATRDAGRIAGLDVVRIVNEPTAAALAYGIGLRTRTAETIAVFDLGGGTFDVSILRVTPAADSGQPSSAGADFFEVLSTAGDTHLGGDDVDNLLVQLVRDALPPDTVLDAADISRLKSAAEAAKVSLSDAPAADIMLTLESGTSVRRTITLAEFESLITPWVERTLASCRRALRDARLKPADIDRIVMVGGATRTPLVRRKVAELFGKEPYTALNPDEVVAMGAAVQASVMSGAVKDLLLLDVLPLSLGVETMGGAVAKLIVRNSTVPARAREMFSTSVDGQTSIKLHILQGEREMVEDCRSLGVFHLRGIPPMPAGVPQVEVEFLVDTSGVLNVSAVERRSGVRAALQVAPNHGLSREEVDRMERESFEHARDDMTRHRVADLITNSRLDLKWIGDRLSKIGHLLEPAYRADLESRCAALAALITAAEQNWRSVDPAQFQRAKEALDQASIRMHEISIAQTLKEQA